MNKYVNGAENTTGGATVAGGKTRPQPVENAGAELRSNTPVNNETDESLDELLDDQLLEDGLEERVDGGVVYSDEVPQELTESYGTGIHPLPGYTEGGRTMLDRAQEIRETSPEVTGGDIDANYEQASTVGDESVGGTAPTPDMDIVDDLGKAVGLEMDDRSFLRTNDVLEERDDRRWELDPGSSEDYSDRRSEEE